MFRMLLPALLISEMHYNSRQYLPTQIFIMKRRDAFKNLVFLTGGITLLPSCLTNSGKASIALKNIDISADQEKLLGEIASTIIPQTDTPGAKEVGSHLFVLKMLDDCYEKEVQQKFISGLNQLEKSTKKSFGNSFVNCTARQKQELLLSIENEEAHSQEVFDFYKIMKERTIQGYLTSKYVVINLEKYELVPSVKYNGYYRVKNV